MRALAQQAGMTMNCPACGTPVRVPPAGPPGSTLKHLLIAAIILAAALLLLPLLGVLIWFWHDIAG